MSTRNLPSDVIHDILVNVPDFTTLLAAIQSCRRFNDVFQTHPKSIVYEVLVNNGGLAVPQAARYAHYKEQDGMQVDDLPNEAHYVGMEWTPHKSLTGIIEENQKAIRILEDFYSLRHKDRASSASKLDPDESLRFQRAMYRYWLYIEASARDAFGGPYAFDYQRAGSGEVLGGLSADELLEILSVRMFCEELMQWQATRDGSDTPYVDRGIDPGTLALDLSRGYSTTPLKGGWAEIRETAHDVLRSRDIDHSRLKQKVSAAIVQTVNGAEDTCERCQAEGGLQLTGTPNVFMLSSVLPFGAKLSLLPRALLDDDDEMRQIRAYLLRGNHGRKVSETELFHELIDTVPEGDDQLQWSKDGWYCLGCVKDLYLQRFMAWWRQKKEQNGGAPHFTFASCSQAMVVCS